MRLTKIKLAGFKSFVDPTTVSFPSNLTGVVGPNGCGKSNVIDAVRWVMGELSAKHLRGESMSDVIFNGSSARKPVGKASVELLFDNADGKIGGAYAAYAEVSLKREVLRDGSSSYHINGARCRRKDITQLFLGTGLGARSYAIIEQGMISRVIEAKSDDMRAFVEEAAGISRYKERRKETESRIADTRENLERLQDVRDEIEKQIRHLQRQAATARRYQSLKEQERRLTAELLALRLRELDRGGIVQDSALREKELALQSAIADLRSAEAGIDKQREFQSEQSELVSGVQGRFFALGADISRSSQQIEFSRETLARKRQDLAEARTTLAELALQIDKDSSALTTLQTELGQIAPLLEQSRTQETTAAAVLESAEVQLGEWQSGWESFNRDLGAAHQTVQVERARIEQLETQLRRLRAQSDRLQIERESLTAQSSEQQLAESVTRESVARSASEQLATALNTALLEVTGLRAAQHSVEIEIDSTRGERERVRAEVMSIDALQRAALGQAEGMSRAWLASVGLSDRPRVAEALAVDSGWERAVETVLGDYLEAVCIDGLEDIEASLGGLGKDGLALFETSAGAQPVASGSLASRVQGPAAVLDFLGAVRTVESLSQAFAVRRSLGAGQSCVTAAGEWVGRGWLRIARGADPHAGVIEREHRLKGLRAKAAEAEVRLQSVDSRLQALRSQILTAEAARDLAQSRIQAAHRGHSEVIAQLEAGRARAQEAALRADRIEMEAAVVSREQMDTDALLARARNELERGRVDLAGLDAQRPNIDSEREERREAVTRARADSQAAQLGARDLMVRVEGRRAAQDAMSVGLRRMTDQRDQLLTRALDLESFLATGDAPVQALQATLDGLLARRVDMEAELGLVRRTLEDADSELRALDERRLLAERRVNETREVMDTVRLAAQETRVRRESIAEQFAETRFELAEVIAQLAEDSDLVVWETRLNEARADIERLGQVNLAAIDELAQNTERKEYLDRQFADLTSALDTLEQAMHKIDKETRSRFEETFERINAGLKEKFPRLFGGGHAYLELVGDDVLSAGVAVMARPPGKRNSSISQLSGGEKALTAVALVFSIFDLNPAPFCLLDEVDAPLDENNVGRFCDIVREMAQRVQFIFITHNKATMELASQLMGVTMNEPGVSRLVSVDVDAAVRLAAS